jgi:hypothetical protein
MDGPSALHTPKDLCKSPDRGRGLDLGLEKFDQSSLSTQGYLSVKRAKVEFALRM